MKGKFSLIWRVAVALVLILSLGMVFSPAPLASAGGSDLSISVTPPDGSNIFCGDTPTVTATVSNAGDECAEDVVITAEVISDPAFATLTNLIPADGLIYDICPDSSKEATWTLTCNGPGPVTVQFTATPTNGAPEVVTVNYNQLCRLGVEITSPADEESFAISDTFAVTAEVTNNTSAACNDVAVTLTPTGNAMIVGGSDTYTINLPAGDTEELNWTMHCDGKGDVDLTVTANGCGQTGGCATACADTITVYQAGVCGLDLVITSDPVGEVCKDGTFTIEGYVKNTGTKTLTGVEAKLAATGTYSSYVSIVTSGWYDVTSSLASGATAPVSWTVTCTGRDETSGQECLDQLVDFDADARATCDTLNDTTDHEDLDNWANQKYAIVTLLPPSVSCHDFCIDDEWLVDVEVENCLDEAAAGHISITVSGNAYLEPTPGASQDMNLPPGGTVRLSDQGGPLRWHVKCTGAGDVDIEVKYFGVAGTTTLCDTDTATVHQKTPAGLAVTVDAPGCEQYCDTFDVTATITNPGGANAAPVSNVNVDMTPSRDVVQIGIPLVTGDGDGDGLLDQDETWVYTWTYHCDGPDDASFKVNVTGTDAVCDATLDASDTDTTEQVKLDIEIVSPVACSTYEVCDTFCVTALITDNDADTCFSGPSDVLTATITFPNAKASLVTNETAAKTFALTDGDTQQVSWTVHCDEPGDTDIMVEVTGTAGDPEGSDEWPLSNKIDTITIHQVTPADLTVEILSPGACGDITELELGTRVKADDPEDAIAEFSTAQSYSGDYSAHLAAKVAHQGDEGRIVIYPPAGMTLGDIQTISWWFYAVTGYPPHVDITLDIDRDGEVDDEDMLTAEMAYNNAQGIEWDEGLPPYITYGKWLQTFELTSGDGYGQIDDSTMLWVTKMGAGNDDAPWGTLAHWKAGIVQHDPGSELATTTIDASAPVVKLEIEVDDWIVASEAYVDCIRINDVPYPPITGTYIATSQDFALTAQISNNGGVPITIDTATVTADTASVLSGPTPALNWTINAGGSVIASWTLHCDAADASCDIEVAVSGTDDLGKPREASNLVTVNQYPAAHLEVQNIDVSDSTVTVCDEFIVTADIVNTGEADAWEVSAILSVFPEGSARVVEGGYSQPLGTLVGHGQDGSETVSWTLHCKVACESTITITAAGYDEFGWHLKQLDGELGLYSEPGRAIPERFIEPASVTVKQVEPPADADLAVEKLVNGEESITSTVGDDVTFTITIDNLLGPADATNVWVYDMLPEGVNFSTWDADQGFYYVGSGQWSVGDLAYGETATLTIVATVNTVGEIHNLATVGYADQHDPDTGNNADVVTITGEPAEPIETVALAVGYNLISLPLIPENPDIEALLSALDVNKVAAYSPGQAWKNYDPDPLVPDDLTEMHDGWGYWIDMGTAGTLSYVGYELVAPPPAVPPSYDLAEGWNLIGFKSTAAKPLGDYLAGIDGKYIILYGYNADSDTYFIAGSAGHEYLQPGLGYWIAMTEPGTIYP